MSDNLDELLTRVARSIAQADGEDYDELPDGYGYEGIRCTRIVGTGSTKEEYDTLALAAIQAIYPTAVPHCLKAAPDDQQPRYRTEEADLIRYRRKALDRTLSDVARDAGCTVVDVSAWERGVKPMPQGKLRAALFHALRLNPGPDTE